MRNYLFAVGGMLACTAFIVAPPQEPVISQATVNAGADNADCQDYTVTATLDGTDQQMVGRACRQQDGNWRITEGPPTQPPQYAALNEPVPYEFYPGYDPWYWGPPIGLSLGAFVFVDRDHHVHHFRHFPHAALHGFHRGFSHGDFFGGRPALRGGFKGGRFGGMSSGRE